MKPETKNTNNMKEITQDIIEGNKLIMEFRGWEEVDSEVYLGYMIPPAELRGTTQPFHPREAKYHTSWDWLQPAWSKFYVLCETTLRGKENMYNEFTDFRDNYNIHANHNNIKAACETLVEALQWYNQNHQ